MTQNFVSSVAIQFEYFDIQLNHPVWAGKKVLDFGGNIGNILLDPNCKIEEENYWCIDVSKSVIEEGQSRYPSATFTFYDSFNFSYNPQGILGLPIPDIGVRFDLILAYSIFSHMDEDEMIEKVGQLIDLLSEDGTLIFTFLDPRFNGSDHYSNFQNITNLEKRLIKLNYGKIDMALLEKSKIAQHLFLVNGKELEENEEGEINPREEGDTLFSYYKPEYLKSIYDCEIKKPPHEPYYESYPAEMQHACIIKKKRS